MHFYRRSSEGLLNSPEVIMLAVQSSKIKRFLVWTLHKYGFLHQDAKTVRECLCTLWPDEHERRHYKEDNLCLSQIPSAYFVIHPEPPAPSHPRTHLTSYHCLPTLWLTNWCGTWILVNLWLWSQNNLKGKDLCMQAQPCLSGSSVNDSLDQKHDILKMFFHADLTVWGFLPPSTLRTSQSPNQLWQKFKQVLSFKHRKGNVAILKQNVS